MARQSNTVVKVLGAIIAVVAGGTAFGYLFGSARLPHPPVQTAPPSVSATLPLPSAPKLNPALIHPHMANGNYTAPGAPRITIEEQSEPILRRVAPPPSAPAADPEASQEATVPSVKDTAPETTPADTTGSPADGTSSAHPSPDASSSQDTSPGPATSPVSTPPTPPRPPADPDFERVNPPKPGPSDPESGQQGGDKTPGKSQTNNFPENGVRAQFRVQTGAYTDESSARTVADALHSQGFTTSTRSERNGDRLVYKVQVGAYRSKNGASKAADDLQKKGYPAFISPMTP